MSFRIQCTLITFGYSNQYFPVDARGTDLTPYTNVLIQTHYVPHLLLFPSGRKTPVTLDLQGLQMCAVCLT